MVEFKDFYFFTVHLSLTEADRNTSIEIINEQVSKIQKPVFLAGDFNAEPSSAAILNLKKNELAVVKRGDYTFPSTKPDRCIDYIFAGNGKKWKIINAEVYNDDIASDHRPVWVELEQ
jgi:endonuclease/exonuclease/phosphatase family metal-dependent hydrolase